VLAEDESGPGEESDAIFAASFNPVRNLRLSRSANTRSHSSARLGHALPVCRIAVTARLHVLPWPLAVARGSSVRWRFGVRRFGVRRVPRGPTPMRGVSCYVDGLCSGARGPPPTAPGNRKEAPPGKGAPHYQRSPPTGFMLLKLWGVCSNAAGSCDPLRPHGCCCAVIVGFQTRLLVWFIAL